MEALPSRSPEGACWCAGGNGGYTVWQDWRGDPHTANPSIVPSETGRAAGSVPKAPGLGNGYLWATGKVSHLRITHSQEALRWRKSADRKRKTVGEWLSFHALQIMRKKRQRCGFGAEEKGSDMSLVQRYALVNSTLKRCCCQTA